MYRLPTNEQTEGTEFTQATLEAAVLGSLFCDPDGEIEARDYLDRVTWVHPYHRIIHQTIVTIWKEGGIPDPDIIVRYLEGSVEFRMMDPITVDDLNDIQDFSHQTVGMGNLGVYAKMLVDRSKNMQIESLIKQSATEVYENIDPKEIASRLVYGLSQIETSKREYMTYAQALDLEVARMHKVSVTDVPFTGVPYGFRNMDRATGGAQPGDLIYLGGRPGMGKTSLLDGIAFSAAMMDKRVAIFNLEMTTEQLIQRSIARLARIDSRMIRSGSMSADDESRYVMAVESLGKLPIIVDDTPSLTPSQLGIKLRRMSQERPIDLVIVDYVQLMKADKETHNRTENISRISRDLKILAREFDVALIAAAQLNRNLEQRQDKRPLLSDLRDSGSIEQDGDIVIFAYRDEVYNPETTISPGQAELIMAKNRHGPPGTYMVGCDMRNTRFYDLAESRKVYQPNRGDQAMAQWTNKAAYDSRNADY